MNLQFAGVCWKGAVQQLTCIIQTFPVAMNDTAIPEYRQVITGTQTLADVTIYKQNIPLSKENKINQTCLDIYYQSFS